MEPLYSLQEFATLVKVPYSTLNGWGNLPPEDTKPRGSFSKARRLPTRYKLSDLMRWYDAQRNARAGG